jgi:hypothetical protein
MRPSTVTALLNSALMFSVRALLAPSGVRERAKKLRPVNLTVTLQSWRQSSSMLKTAESSRAHSFCLPRTTSRPAIRNRIGEPFDVEAEPRVIEGKPYLLVGNRDCAENWSGGYVRDVHSFVVKLVGKPISRAAFWRLVMGLN